MRIVKHNFGLLIPLLCELLHISFVKPSTAFTSHYQYKLLYKLKRDVHLISFLLITKAFFIEGKSLWLLNSFNV